MEWQPSGRRRRESLSGWCDGVLTAPRFLRFNYLVSKGKATEAVTSILKKYRQYGPTFGPSQQRALEKELDGAGDWEKAASASVVPGGVVAGEVQRLEKQLAAARLTAASAAPTGMAAAQRGRSGGRAAEQSDKPVSRKRGGRGQPKARKLWPEATPAAASSAAAAADIPVEGEGGTTGRGVAVETKVKPTLWTCPACETGHDWVPKKGCILCRLPRVVAGPAAQAATSAEEDAEKIAKLRGVVAALEELGSATTDDKVVIDSYMAKIAHLSKPRAPTPELPASARLSAAMVAVEATQARNAVLEEVQQSLQREIDRKQEEMVRVAAAMARALAEHQAAEAALAAAERQLPAAAAGPAATPATAAAPAPQADIRAMLICAMQHSMHHSPGKDDNKEKLCTDALQAFDVLIAGLASGLAALAAPQPAATAPRARPAAAPVGTGEAGESCLNKRIDLKVESKNAESRTRAAMQGAAKLQRDALRQQMAADGRSEAEIKARTDELAAADAEDRADLSDSEAGAAAIS